MSTQNDEPAARSVDSETDTRHDEVQVRAEPKEIQTLLDQEDGQDRSSATEAAATYKTVIAATVNAYLLTRSVEVTAVAGGLGLLAMVVFRRR